MQRSSGSAGQPADRSAESSSDKGGSAEQPVTSLRSAEQPVVNNLAEQLVSDAGGEMQPNKRCKHDGMMLSSKDFILPEILQPIKAALAEEIDKFEVECEQWDPPTFEEDATEEDEPTFRLRNVYERLRSIRARGCLSTCTKKGGICSNRRTSCIAPQRRRFKCVSLLAEEAGHSERIAC